MSEVLDYLVVGAGPAGLAAASLELTADALAAIAAAAPADAIAGERYPERLARAAGK